ncbi:16S rRNA (cytosine(967)-C(5))-methyltransferase RsmB [Aequoribacter sp.]|uniref:16S rRNA (cytosine(967)-C(5))-methyltransferase RsmB n=1 Tax=Aequoribacter sp. TaxID=2847771 RepID=UPI003C4A53A2
MNPSIARLSAVQAVSQVLTGHAIRVSDFDQGLDPQQKAFAHQLAQGTINALPRLSGLLNQLLSKPIKPKEAEVHAILLTGLYQIEYMRTPDHAAVNESVNLAKKLKRTWAIKLINGCLRRFLREQDTLRANLTNAAEAAHSEWMYQMVVAQWPERAAEIIDANNHAGPMCLRVNPRLHSADDYLQTLRSIDIDGTLSELAPECIRLNQACSVEKLPGFDKGWVSIQDEAAQVAAQLFAIEPKQKVLDACSAPGGKTCHLAELYPDAHFVARDINSERLLKVRESSERLGLTIDIQELSQAQDAEQVCFDHILADVPCSGSGVVRRHPDIKTLRLESDLAQFHAQQLQILQNLWPKLKPGGTLLYVTCSIFEQENDQTIRLFLQQEKQASIQAINKSWGYTTEFGRQLIPQRDGSDGLYFCRVQKA